METRRYPKKQANLTLSLVMGMILSIASILALSLAVNVKVELGALHIAELLGQCLPW